MVENTDTFVSDQLAVKTWSVLARDLAEGGSTVLLLEEWDAANDSVVIFPSYAGQEPLAIKPDVWTSWRHELKPPKAGHTRIRNVASVVATIPITDGNALAAIEGEHGLTQVEARRRFAAAGSGLVAVVLRVYHLPRTYKFQDVSGKEGAAGFVPLPFDVEREDLSPVIDDTEFERRVARIRSAISGADEAPKVSEPTTAGESTAQMSEHAEVSNKKVYVQYAGILGVLAVLTVVMIFIGESSMSQAPKVLLLLLGSATKASLIIFYFMHLKFEKMGLILTVMIGIFLTSVLMFAIPAYDGGYILENSLFK